MHLPFPPLPQIKEHQPTPLISHKFPPTSYLGEIREGPLTEWWEGVFWEGAASAPQSHPGLLLGQSGHIGQEPTEYTQGMGANVDITPGRINV